MDFSLALKLLKAGKFVSRCGWNGKGMYLRLHVGYLEEELPYIELFTVDGKFVPWVASQTDILAEDYGIITIV